MDWYQAVGWAGTTLYLLNYAYLAFHPHYRPRVYFIANALAATALVLTSVVLSSWQAVGINGFWAVISLWMLTGRGFAWVRLDRRALEWGVGALLTVAALALLQHWRLSIEWLAWSSTYTFSLAYLLFAADRLSIARFHFWNLYAPFVLLPQLFLDENWPVLVMEAAWCCISFVALLRVRKPALNA